MCSSSQKQNHLLDAWADPGSDLKGFQQNPQTIGPPGKPEGNVVHRVHNAVSPEIAYGGLQDSDVCSQGRDWDCIYVPFPHASHLLSIHLNLVFIH
jgi:hypothetical protein